MATPIPVPTYELVRFPRMGMDVSDLPTPIDPAFGQPFPFWKYVALSVTAGVITHYLLRFLNRSKPKGA